MAPMSDVLLSNDVPAYPSSVEKQLPPCPSCGACRAVASHQRPCIPRLPTLRAADPAAQPATFDAGATTTGMYVCLVCLSSCHQH